MIYSICCAAMHIMHCCTTPQILWSTGPFRWSIIRYIWCKCFGNIPL